MSPRSLHAACRRRQSLIISTRSMDNIRRLNPWISRLMLKKWLLNVIGWYVEGRNGLRVVDWLILCKVWLQLLLSSHHHHLVRVVLQHTLILSYLHMILHIRIRLKSRSYCKLGFFKRGRLHNLICWICLTPDILKHLLLIWLLLSLIRVVIILI